MALQDKIGRKDIVVKICGLVDSLQKDQNFCLSLNGAWGSGKSFVLKMIEEQLVQKQEYVVVKYDAWKNNFYSDPLIAILYCIAETLEKLFLDNTEYRAKKTASKIIKSVAETSLKAVAESKGYVGFIAKAVLKIREIIKEYKKTALTNNAKFNEYKSYSLFLENTIEQLNEITTQNIVQDKQTRFVVLVDEIDRCLPDEQLKILERLHHLLNIKNCAVIVAMNQICIAQTVKTIYGIDGNEYLHKFFDFTYKLETSANEYFKSLLDEFVKKFEKLQKPANEQEFPIKLAYQCLLYGDNKVLDKVDNREISRYYDSLLNICNDYGWEKLTQQYVFFVVLALFIRKHISSTFLSEKEMYDNQESVESKTVHGSVAYDEYDDEMSYFDYLLEYIGIDRENLPESIVQLYRWGGSHIPEFSWWFNEIVYFSMGKQFYQNEMRAFYHQPTVHPEQCQELRRLVILYGGEQERCDK